MDGCAPGHADGSGGWVEAVGEALQFAGLRFVVVPPRVVLLQGWRREPGQGFVGAELLDPPHTRSQHLRGVHEFVNDGLADFGQIIEVGLGVDDGEDPVEAGLR